ncbi:hypothetical protein [Lacipirellula parvula]|uniref:Uncharacterized protein n=1 Tax=Lacipirellula parvula TaxID=2650471 RepID=A0A5K7XH61_9BACT|nr:hypothetical protein [Lacipirellula parvula]BBO35382.1 hypothetical protein PLANPX_4994 [Lacipirellula parvula]
MNATYHSANPSNNSELSGEWLKAAPPYRRCLWYICLSFVGLACLGGWISSKVIGRPLDDVLVGVIFMLMISLSAALTLRWRLHVGADGITRRRVFWQDCWTWNDFASGRIRKSEGYAAVLIDPARPWWRRHLRIDYLSGPDCIAVLKLINAAYVLPPAAEVPDEIVIWSGWERWQFSPEGIRLKSRNKNWEYAWADVQWLNMQRADEKRLDFLHLCLELPDRKLKLAYATHQGGRTPTWRGATAEVIGMMLTMYIDPSRVEILIPGTRPRRLEEIRKEHEKLQERLRGSLLAYALIGLVLSAAIVWIGMTKGWVPALIMTLPYGSMVGGVAWSMRKRALAKLAQLKTWIDEMSDGDDRT